MSVARRLMFAGLAVFWSCSGTSSVRAELPVEGPVKPTEVRKIYGNGKHNAFTAFVRWKGALWVAFRQAAAHNSVDGDLVVEVGCGAGG